MRWTHLWAHDPSSQHPDFSPPEPAASSSANWTVPIFWPLSVQWARIQLPAWLPAQDGHGRWQALCRGGVGGRGGFPFAAWTHPKPLRVQRLGICVAIPPFRPPIQLHRTVPFASPSVSSMTQVLSHPPLHTHLKRRESAGPLPIFSNLTQQPCRKRCFQHHFRDRVESQRRLASCPI